MPSRGFLYFIKINAVKTNEIRNKTKDRNCKCGYINEISIKEKIKSEVERFKKFQQVVLNIKEKINIVDIDIRNYAKYILREGTDLEKRELLGCLRSKLEIRDKIVYLKIDSA